MESLNGIFSCFDEIIEYFFHFGGIKAPPKPLKTSISVVLGGLYPPLNEKNIELFHQILKIYYFNFPYHFDF